MWAPYYLCCTLRMMNGCAHTHEEEKGEKRPKLLLQAQIKFLFFAGGWQEDIWKTSLIYYLVCWFHFCKLPGFSWVSKYFRLEYFWAGWKKAGLESIRTHIMSVLVQFPNQRASTVLWPVWNDLKPVPGGLLSTLLNTSLQVAFLAASKRGQGLKSHGG